MKQSANKSIPGKYILDILSMLKDMYGENFDQTLRETPRIGDHFVFMQIRTLKLSHMKPCGIQSMRGNSILDIQNTLQSMLTLCMVKILTKSRIKPNNWWPFWTCAN